MYIHVYTPKNVREKVCIIYYIYMYTVYTCMCIGHGSNPNIVVYSYSEVIVPNHKHSIMHTCILIIMEVALYCLK